MNEHKELEGIIDKQTIMQYAKAYLEASIVKVYNEPERYKEKRYREMVDRYIVLLKDLVQAIHEAGYRKTDITEKEIEEIIKECVYQLPTNEHQDLMLGSWTKLIKNTILNRIGKKDNMRSMTKDEVLAVWWTKDGELVFEKDPQKEKDKPIYEYEGEVVAREDLNNKYIGEINPEQVYEALMKIKEGTKVRVEIYKAEEDSQ